MLALDQEAPDVFSAGGQLVATYSQENMIRAPAVRGA
jgi:hypothetical protein